MGTLQIYSLCGPGKLPTQAALNSPYATGISIRQSWEDIEASPGVYNFDYLDAAVAKVELSGKALMLRITHGGDHYPPWLLNAGAQYYETISNNPYQPQYGELHKLVLWWDPLYLQAAQALLSQVASRYSNTVEVFQLSVANSWTAEWNVYRQAGSDDVQELLGLGFTTDILLNAVKTIIRHAHQIFPVGEMAIDIGPTPAALTGLSDNYEPVRQLWTWLAVNYPGRFLYQANDLSLLTSAPSTPDKRWQVMLNVAPYLAAQHLWFVYGDTTYRMSGGDSSIPPANVLQGSIQNGVLYGTKWQEVYQVDVVNFPEVMAWASTVQIP